jgi:hypothetical protein
VGVPSSETDSSALAHLEQDLDPHRLLEKVRQHLREEEEGDEATQA